MFESIEESLTEIGLIGDDINATAWGVVLIGALLFVMVLRE